MKQFAFTLIVAVSAMLGFSSCTKSSKPQDVENKWEYSHVESYADIYSDSILRLDPSSVAMQQLLLDINHRANRLAKAEGEELAEYFRYTIEEKVRKANAAFADSVFGAPYATFFPR